MRSAPVILFVPDFIGFVDTTFQYHMCLRYSRMFSRQLLKLVVDFKVWEAFFIRFSCIRIEVSELDKMEICSMLKSFKKYYPHFLDDKLMQQKYSAYQQLQMPSHMKWQITSVCTFRSITAISAVPDFLKRYYSCRQSKLSPFDRFRLFYRGTTHCKAQTVIDSFLHTHKAQQPAQRLSHCTTKQG